MAEQSQTQDINQLLKVRREKLADLQANGKDPFQIMKYDVTYHSADACGADSVYCRAYDAEESDG